MKNPRVHREMIAQGRKRSYDHELERNVRFKRARHHNTGSEERVAAALRGESNERR